jgi:hypothetical protein
MTRRGFFRAAVRLLVGGTLGTVSVMLMARGRASGRFGEVCTTGGACPGCPSYGSCGLPRALSAKRVRGD